MRPHEVHCEKRGPPGDVDIFVCGKNGSSEEEFRKFMNSVVVKKLKEIYRFPSSAKFIGCEYCFRGVECHIANLVIPGISSKLSFISSPGCENVKQVINRFDIDVCKVICNIHFEQYEVEESVKEHIKGSKAAVHDLVFGKCIPDKFDIYKCMRTLQRMKKYNERGFVFTNGGGLCFGINPHIK